MLAEGPPPWRAAAAAGSGGWLVLELDRGVLEQRILPQLAGRYLGQPEFGLRIVAKDDPQRVIFESGPPMSPAANIETTADLFGPLVFARRPAGPPFAVPAPPARAHRASRARRPGRAGRRGRSVAIAPVAPRPPAAVKVPVPPLPPTPPAPAAGPPLFSSAAPKASGAPIEIGEGRWRLEVYHQEGSLDAAIDRAQQRNLTIALGILVVLGGSMLFLALAARRAQELARRQMELVAGVTHELLTPLAAMKSAGQNLRDGVVREPPKVARYGELIVTESDRLSALVGQVLMWAGLASHEGTLRRERMPPRQLAEEALEALRPGLETANFEVAFEVPADLPEVDGDRAALRQALGNLIANAVKHGQPAEGRPFLRLAARRAGERIVFEVADRGAGIAAEDLPHLEPSTAAAKWWPALWPAPGSARAGAADRRGARRRDRGGLGRSAAAPPSRCTCRYRRRRHEREGAADRRRAQPGAHPRRPAARRRFRGRHRKTTARPASNGPCASLSTCCCSISTCRAKVGSTSAATCAAKEGAADPDAHRPRPGDRQGGRAAPSAPTTTWPNPST